jgi:hypothetical protein
LILKNQPYKKFDISKLDFSFDIPSNKLESDKNLNCKGQYTTVVSKSRSNINKIIELNKLVKDVKVKLGCPPRVICHFLDQICSLKFREEYFKKQKRFRFSTPKFFWLGQ